MDQLTFELLTDCTNEDCANYINEFYKDLLRMDFVEIFKTAYPMPIEIYKERVNYGHLGYPDGYENIKSRLIMYNPINNMKIAVIRTLSCWDNMKSRFHMTHNIDKYLYIGQKQYRICTNWVAPLNQRNPILDYGTMEKETLVSWCHINNVKAYKSWKKSRIIQALIKA
jgi:hypothetical protein